MTSGRALRRAGTARPASRCAANLRRGPRLQPRTSWHWTTQATRNRGDGSSPASWRPCKDCSRRPTRGSARCWRRWRRSCLLTAFDIRPFSADDVARDVVFFRNNLEARAGEAESRGPEASDRSRRTRWMRTSVCLGGRACRQPADGGQRCSSARMSRSFRRSPSPPRRRPSSATRTRRATRSRTTCARSRRSTFPSDDWLHGVARVREKMHAWEQAAALAATLGGTEPDITPIQLPYRAGEGWLALEFDPTKPPDGERLLYTAHYPAGYASRIRPGGRDVRRVDRRMDRGGARA